MCREAQHGGPYEIVIMWHWRRIRPHHHVALRAWLAGEAGNRNEFEAAVRALNAPKNLSRFQESNRDRVRE